MLRRFRCVQIFLFSFHPKGVLKLKRLSCRVYFPVLLEPRGRSYGCPYCASHTSVMGTVWRGAGLTLEKNSLAMDPDPSPEIFSPQELTAINISKKVLLETTSCFRRAPLGGGGGISALKKQGKQ